MRAYLGIAALAVASAAHAAPLTQLEADVDGDGASDRVAVDPAGELVVEGPHRTVLPLRPSLVKAAVTATLAQGMPTLVVVTASADEERTFVFVRDRNGWRELVSERTGPVDEDSDYRIALTANETGIYRSQTRPGVRRCDGKPVYLFAEGWNGKRFQRLSKIPTGVPASAPVVTARVEGGPSAAPLLYQARVASHQPDAEDAGALGIPMEIADSKPGTFWYEGFANSAGEGQFFTFEARIPTARASRVRIVPGRPKPTASARMFNRPRRIAIVGANGAWHIDLPDAAAASPETAYVADLPTPIEGCATVVLESTFGPANGVTAIAELAVLAEAERATDGGVAALARAVREGNDGVHAAAQALAQRGASAVAAIDQELGRATDDQARHRLARALIGIKDATAGPAVARAILLGAVHEQDLQQAVQALAAMGLSAQLREVVAGSDVALEARVTAARALAGNPQVLALAGTGPLRLRQALVEAMSTIAVPALVVAARNAASPAAEGDVWRAITRRAVMTSSERSDAVAAMRTALDSTSAYECRYRLVDGVASLGDPDELDTLHLHISKLAPPVREALEVVAARAVARHPRHGATNFLLSLARDLDPGVRGAALAALGGNNGTAAATGWTEVGTAIRVALTGDRWPDVRRTAARALASRCVDPAVAHVLTQSVRRDPDIAVRDAALAALVDCRAAGTGELLVNVWNDRSLPTALRTSAIGLSTVLGDHATAVHLVDAFERWRRDALTSPTALALAQTSAQALGHLAPPGAADALLRALTATDTPELVAAAAAALGATGRLCSVVVKKRLQSLAGVTDQQVRFAAARAALQCGK